MNHSDDVIDDVIDIKDEIFALLFRGSEEEVQSEIYSAWTESHRYYHTFDEHLIPLIEMIDEEYEGKSLIKSCLKLMAYFHDIVYCPKSNDNELKSKDLFLKLVKPGNEPIVQIIANAILDTAHHTRLGFKPSSEISSIFMGYDVRGLVKGTVTELIRTENLIFKEFQFTDYGTYAIKRSMFLNAFMDIHKENIVNITQLKDYIYSRKPKVGLYAGSFNPFHIGHYDIFCKAEQMFDKVIIAQGINKAKEVPQTILKDNVPEVLKYKHIIYHDGLLTNLVSNLKQEHDVTLIRGLRNGSDLQQEQNLLAFLMEFDPLIKAIYILCDSAYAHISSSALRELEKFDKKLLNSYILRV